MFENSPRGSEPAKGRGVFVTSKRQSIERWMDFLQSYLPGPVVDIFLPIALVLLVGWIAIPRILAKLKETGVWDRILDRFGGEKLRLMQFEREISRLQKSGNVVGAARLYEEAEWYPEAIKLYVEAEEYNSAAALYEGLEQWERAADMYLKAEDWKRAARMYAKVNRHTEAAKLFEQHGQKIDAAKLYFDAGQYDRAAALYEDVSDFPQAAKCFEKLGQYLKAAENYEAHWSATTSVGGGGLIAAPSDRESKIALHAGQLYEKAGAPERAAELYKRAGLSQQAATLAAKEGRYRDAGEMLLKEEKLEEAAEMFAKAGDAKRAALLRGEIAFHRGESARAADEFLAGGDNLRAAEIYESVGNLEAAARCYQESDAPLQAANVYLRANEKAKAAAMFEQGRDFAQAASLYAANGDLGKASELYEQSERFFDAGKLAHELGDADRAIRLLQQLDASDESYDRATLILSRLFVDKNMPALAVDKLKRLLGGQQISAQTLEHYYALGLAYEKLGQNAEAVETFRKVLTERYGYEDVEQRIARLSSAPATGPEPAAPLAPATHGGPAPTAYATSTAAAPAPRSAPAPAASAPPPRPPTPSPTSPSRTPSPPHTAGSSAPSPPIRLEQELGKGLLGTSYRGLDTRSQRPVTVKLLRADLLKDPRIVQRFLAEAKVARGLDHPSLVRLLGLVELEGQKAVITEYVEGFDLKAFIARNKKITIKQALDLLTNLSLAMGYAHERKLLHRDLKPTNILIGKAGKLRLTGFGLGALRLRELGRADGYPAPELLSGGAIDARSDIYSLGAVIFHALTGFHPDSEAISSNGTPELRQHVPEAPQHLDRILARCLVRDPAGRFGSTAEIAAAARALSV